MTESAVKVEIENLSEVKRKLTIEVPSTEVTQAVDRAYRDLGKKAKVKGFRPGKVPRSILEMYYHKDIDHDVSETLVRQSLAEALKDKGLDAINLSWPEPVPPVVAGEDFCYSVEIEVAPEFAAEDYLGLTLAAPEVVVTDAEVEARLEEIRQANAILKPLAEDRGVKAGDFVILDHQAHFAGQPVEGGKSEGTYVEVGSGKFNAEFETNLLGLKAGAEARFPVALPDDFANPLIAGKVVDFAVNVQEVKEKVVAELDDTFSKNLGGNFQTLADLRTAVREDIIKGKEQERQALLENQVSDRLLARHQFEVPPSLVTQEQENMLREQMDRFRQHGMDTAGMDPARIREVMKPMAERRVRVRLILSRIADQENLAVDEAEMDAALARIAVNNRRDVVEIKKFYAEHDLLGALRRTLLDDKTMKLLLDKAEITAAAAEAAEPAGEKE
ncbi:MAG: trigger factor [Desulfobacterales bacterium]|nr:trigger factor [Pseudomonadota bacterium]MBU4356115.1 trigger factor [Pseudomonadota bacterium]MCG2771550.1 trigger factor [Desulfobacterales bacterium]